MAGSDQSVNLGGMLSGISNTIGGMSAAGKGYNEGFIQAFKPQIDPGSPESLQAAAEWARSNGRLDEAKQYTSQANTVALTNNAKDVEKREMAINEKITSAGERLAKAQQAGDEPGFAKARAELVALSKDPKGTVASQEKIEGLLKEMRKPEVMKSLRANASNNKAQGAVKLASLLENPEYREKAGEVRTEQLEANLNQMLGDKDVLAAYNAHVAEQAKMVTAQRDEQDRAELQADQAELAKKLDNGDLEGAAKVLGKSRFAKELAPILDNQKKLNDMRQLGTDAEGVVGMEKLVTSAIEGLGKFKNQGSEGFQKEYSDALETVMAIKDPKMQVGRLKNMLTIITNKSDAYTEQALAAEQDYVTWVRGEESTISATRPDQEMMDAFEDAQKASVSFADKFALWIGDNPLDEQDKRNAERDYRRAEKGIPTKHYAFDSKGNMIFDKNGKPKPAPKGYQSAAQIGQGMRNSVTGQRAVSQEQYDALDPNFRHQVYVDPTL